MVNELKEREVIMLRNSIEKKAAVFAAAAVMILIVVSEAVSTAPVSAASVKDSGQNHDDPFAFRGGAVLQSLREEAVKYPDAFDLRNVDTDGNGTPDKNFVTKVKLQNPYGSCWGFAAASAAESALIADGLADENVDLSEKHIVWFTTSHIDDPESLQNGEGWHFKEVTSEDLKTSAYRYETGGNSMYATVLFSSGMGPVVENAKDPETGESLETVLGYRGKRGEKIVRRTAVAYDKDGNPTKWARKAVWNSEDDDWSVPDKYRYLQSYRLKDSMLLPGLLDAPGKLNEDSLNAWKQVMCMSHRAISVSFCAESYLPGQDTENKKYISNNWAHYVYDSEFANHAVTVVAWDDNYPKENFRHPVTDPDHTEEDTVPPGDGAFLIKNSWGSELNDFPDNGYRHWGLLEGLDGVPYDPGAKAKSDRATGYFWISYYDRSLGDPEALVFDKANDGNDYEIAQTDFLEASYFDIYENSKDCRSANVFTADKTSELKEISVVTTIPGTEVSYAVYMLPDGFNDPEDGVKIAEGKAGPFNYGGYHRFKINASKVLSKNQKYSVVISEKADMDYPYRDSIDGTYAAYKTYYNSSMPSNFYSKAIVNEGESFCTVNGEWKDISDKEVQGDITHSYNNEMDNFPIKAFLDPVMNGDEPFTGYIAVSNWQEGTPGIFTMFPEDSKTVTAEFRGLSTDMPDTWDPEITWTSSNDQVVSVTPKKDDYGEAVIKGLSGGKAYIMVDAGKYGSRVIGINVKKPEVEFFFLDDTDDQVYTGKEMKPAVTDVYMESSNYDKEEYVEGVDYEVKYENNIDAGTATVTVNGIGLYGGSSTEEFQILKAPNTMKAKGRTVKLKAAALKKKAKVIKASKAFNVKAANGKVTYKKVKGSKNFKVASSGKITVKKGTKKGKYKITVNVSAAGNNNYEAASKKVKVTVKVA